jgi:hypothetical protein
MKSPPIDDIHQFLSLGSFNIPVIETPYALEHKEVKRTWRERLFSRPWRPWVKTKIVTRPAIFVLSSTKRDLLSRLRIRVSGLYDVPVTIGARDTIVAHPTLVAQIKNLAVEKK